MFGRVSGDPDRGCRDGYPVWVDSGPSYYRSKTLVKFVSKDRSFNN